MSPSRILTERALTQLILHDNKIGPEGASALADALKVNTSLTEVLAFLPKLNPLPPLETLSTKLIASRS